MLRFAILCVRIVSYGALALVAGGVACMVFVSVAGVCPRFDEGAIQCSSPIFETIGGLGLMIVLVTAFTGVPALLALVGLVFLIRDAVALSRRHGKQGAPPRPAAPAGRTSGP